MYRLVPLWIEVLQGQRRIEKLCHDLQMWYQDLSEMSPILLLRPTETNVSLGRMTHVTLLVIGVFERFALRASTCSSI